MENVCFLLILPVEILKHSVAERILTWGFLLKSSVNDYVIKSSSLLSEISSIRKINCNFKNSGEGKEINDTTRNPHSSPIVQVLSGESR